MTARDREAIPPFTRAFFTSGESFSRIGEGGLGGKAKGLALVHKTILNSGAEGQHPGVVVDIPTSTLLTTEVFDAFMERNRLTDLALSDEPDDRIALAFQKADVPVEFVGDLRALIEGVQSPLAVRSSSLLEDAMFRPFAGVYQTKMIPNNQPDPDVRFRKLLEAVKFVYASVYSRNAKSYVRATDRAITDEKMAVIIQEIVGERHDVRFYPTISGVARSYNFYPSRGTPEEGVVNLALGLGKTIVDGGISWPYSPAQPNAPPPFGSVSELLSNTQVQFWAVNMGAPPAYDPIAETEYLIQADLETAHLDGTLKHVASTYDPERERVEIGAYGSGARILNFAPLLQLGEFEFSEVIKRLLGASEDAFGTAVEIEFAAILPEESGRRARIAFLQVRPMVVPEETVTIADDEMLAENLLLASDRVMGNGVRNDIRDIVFVKPESFEARLTTRIAGEMERLNRSLMQDDTAYLLIGYGRWGSSDPWLGIPVEWGQICGARAIVEATLPAMRVELSQGSHFFHNISSFQVSYFTVHHDRGAQIAWDWLRSQTTVAETDHVRHVRCEQPLRVKVDGRTGRGGIWHD